MPRQYYSTRNGPKPLTFLQLCIKAQQLCGYFRTRDYFKRDGDTAVVQTVSEELRQAAALAIDFDPFDENGWDLKKVTEDNIFDSIEFLYDNVAKPFGWIDDMMDNGYHYVGYQTFDEKAGQLEFLAAANGFLPRYRGGYELNSDGVIMAKGSEGVQFILDAEIPKLGVAEVDEKVLDAVAKWRNRQLDVGLKKAAILEMANVFEWLQKTKRLEKVLSHKDESDLFQIANNFALRHHNPKQKQNYDENIWYAWMFHFYLATYHAVVRLLKKQEGKKP